MLRICRKSNSYADSFEVFLFFFFNLHKLFYRWAQKVISPFLNCFYKISQRIWLPVTLFGFLQKLIHASAIHVWIFLENFKACVRYFLSSFSTKWLALPKLWKVFFILSKKLFSFLRYSNFCNFFPSFPHFPDTKGQMEVE